VSVGVRLREDLEQAAGNAMGRLYPSLIQAIVRASFPTFRHCYEEGLGRDPKLTGIVKARFVIDREGKVKHVADAGSTLPDEKVKSCVLQSFYKLRFPPPADGTVTIVYPIHLAPG
jgi:Ca-activated chloride channel family protein